MTSCAHLLEFQRPGDSRIGQSAGRFLASALRDGGVALAIAGSRTAKGIVAELSRSGLDPVAAMQRGRFVLFESSEMLSRFSTRSGVSAEQFDRTVGAAMREAKARANGAPLRAFGDMVGVLWQRDKRETAVELEQLWNYLQQELGFELFCTYPIDVFGKEFTAGSLDGVLSTHTHLSPNPASAELGRALDRAMEEVLGETAWDVRLVDTDKTGHPWPSMPKLEKNILWLRTHMPEYAETVLERARTYFEHAAPRVYLRQEHSSR